MFDIVLFLIRLLSCLYLVVSGELVSALSIQIVRVASISLSKGSTMYCIINPDNQQVISLPSLLENPPLTSLLPWNPCYLSVCFQIIVTISRERFLQSDVALAQVKFDSWTA